MSDNNDSHLLELLCKRENLEVLDDLIEKTEVRKNLLVPVQSEKLLRNHDYSRDLIEIAQFSNEFFEIEETQLPTLRAKCWKDFGLFGKIIYYSPLIVSALTASSGALVDFSSPKEIIAYSLLAIASPIILFIGNRTRDRHFRGPAYQNRIKTVFLSPLDLQSINIFDLAHEYTHYLLREKRPLESHLATSEGLCNGFARQFARNYSTTYNDQTPEYQTERAHLFYLRRTRKWLERFFEGKEKLKVHKGPCGFTEKMTLHILGSALFDIAQSRYGPNIYKDVFNGKVDLTTVLT